MLVRFLISALVSLVSTIASAAELKDSITAYGSFVHTSMAPNALFFFAPIEVGDSFEFRRAVRNHDIDLVVLASPGGSVFEGLQIAAAIHDKKLSTYIPSLEAQVGCFSACSYLFFAGATREVDGLLGVHQTGLYDPSAEKEEKPIGELQNQTQFTVSEVIGFLNEFGTPPWVYERMFRSTDMHVFTDDELFQLKRGQIEEQKKQEVIAFIQAVRATGEENRQSEAEGSTHESSTEPRIENEEFFDVENRELVSAIQSALNTLNCGAGQVDGVWGRRTESAARKFAELNNLEFKGPEDIDAAFIELLVSDKPQVCPKSPPKPAYAVLSPNWTFNLNCGASNQRQLVGTATLSFQRHTNGTSFYSVVFGDSDGKIFTGTLRHIKSEIWFDLKQENGPFFSRGWAAFNANMTVARGSTEAGCGFDATRQ